MSLRALWKGYLKVGELACPVSLYAAASTSERVTFHTLNRKTGNRVKRQFVDGETGKPVDSEEQVKGYETENGHVVLLEPEEISAAVPESDKTFDVEAFIACGDIDTVYFDKPYFLAPSDASGAKAYAVIREGMSAKGVAAIASTVLFRRVRTVLIRAQGHGLVANTLNFDYEIRSADAAFDEIPDLKIKGDMLELAKHIISTKAGTFDPATFDDRYDNALAELVQAKQEGREIKAPKRKPEGKVVDLMEALRKSAAAAESAKSARESVKKTAPKRKAG